MLRFIKANQFILGMSLAASLVHAVAGCSILPLPENASGVAPKQIEKKIRCETREALKQIVLEVIRNPRSPGFVNNAIVARDIELNDRILQNKKYFSRLSKDAHAALEKYDGAAIGFDFTFTATENNSLQGNLNLLSTVKFGTDALNFSAGNTRERKTITNFRTTEILADFFKPNLECVGYNYYGNYVYPLTGEIGMYIILKDFFELNETGNLGLSLTDKTSLYAIQVSFTTTFTGTVNPKIVITTVGKAFGLPEAGITASATRSDIHTLVIALSLPKERAIGFVGPGGVPLPALQGDLNLARLNVNNQLTYQIDKNRPIFLVRPDLINTSLFPY